MGEVRPFEVLAHRVLWSAVFLWCVLAWQGLYRQLRAVWRERTLLILFGTTLLIAVNWLVYIWAVQNDHVVEASLGYFINPLFSTALGVWVLRERLRPLTRWAVLLAAIGVGYQALGMRDLPWVALVLAISFGLYGLLRKLAPVEAVVGLTIETSLLIPVALLALLIWNSDGSLAFLHSSWGLSGWLLLAGPITAIPLLCFNKAARILPLSTLGFLQYLAPTGQFLLGVFAFGEPFPPGQWITFGCIWTGLILFSLDLVRPQ